eukprot:604661-Pelagomonas_calceolata.AAC.2
MTVARLQERLGEALCEAEVAKQQQQQLVVVKSAGQEQQLTRPQYFKCVDGVDAQYFNGADDVKVPRAPNSQTLRRSLEVLLSQLAGEEVSAAALAQHDAAAQCNAPTHEAGRKHVQCSSPMHDAIQQHAQSRRVAGYSSVVPTGVHVAVTASTGAAGLAAQPAAAGQGCLSLAEAIQLVEATCVRKQVGGIWLWQFD